MHLWEISPLTGRVEIDEALFAHDIGIGSRAARQHWSLGNKKPQIHNYCVFFIEVYMSRQGGKSELLLLDLEIKTLFCPLFFNIILHHVLY